MDPKPIKDLPPSLQGLSTAPRAVAGSELGKRFDYVKYDEKSMEAQNDFKTLFIGVEAAIEKHMPHGSRAKVLVLTKLEEAYMWIGKAIRDAQIQREGQAPLQEERKNG